MDFVRVWVGWAYLGEHIAPGNEEPSFCHWRALELIFVVEGSMVRIADLGCVNSPKIAPPVLGRKLSFADLRTFLLCSTTFNVCAL